MDESPTESAQSPFRFLDDAEYAALSRAEQLQYLRRALEETKRGESLLTTKKRA